MADDNFVWQVRAFIHEQYVKATCAPGITDIAESFGLTAAQAKQGLLALHEKHAISLEPGTVNIRIADLFSAIPRPSPILRIVPDRTGSLRSATLRARLNRHVRHHTQCRNSYSED